MRSDRASKSLSVVCVVPRTAKPKPVLTFCADSREQRGYQWTRCVRKEFECGGTLIRALGEGDYACAIQGGDILPIRVERKSLGDLWGVCGYGRERFERELERLQQYERRYIAVEASWPTIIAGYDRSTITGRIAAASLMSWIDEWDLLPLMADDKKLVSGLVRRALEEFAARWIKRAAQ